MSHTSYIHIRCHSGHYRSRYMTARRDKVTVSSIYPYGVILHHIIKLHLEILNIKRNEKNKQDVDVPSCFLIFLDQVLEF